MKPPNCIKIVLPSVLFLVGIVPGTAQAQICTNTGCTSAGVSGSVTFTQSGSNSNAIIAQETGTGFAISALGGTSGGGGVYAAAADGAFASIEGYSLSNTIGVWGQNTAGGDGVFGSSASGNGVGGISTNGTGVYGVSSTGNGLLGSSSSSGASGVYGVNTSGGGYGVAGRLSPAGNGYAIYGDNQGGGGWAGYFRGNVYATGTFSSSDVNLKKNIKPLESPVDQLTKLHGVSFEWKDDSRGKGPQMGFIAQDYEKVFPQWVVTDSEGYKAISTSGLQALTVESIRALKAENDLLKQRVAALESGRQPRIAGFNLNGVGFGVGGVGIGLGLVISRRKREEEQS
jgi:hypothetical protein